MEKKSKIKLTKKGYQDLILEIKELKEVKRPKLLERLANARSQGDLRENSDYQNARQDLEFLDARIAELEEMLEKAEIVEEKENEDGKVSLGSRVKIRSNGKEMVFTLVGQNEADPSNLKISIASPLGSALLDKRIGDIVEVETPSGKLSYEILDIS